GVVTVGDGGPGCARGAQERLFEPFFTTKGADGAGLGLWLASGTMERLGGRIRVTNRPRRGALVEMTFPFVAAERQRKSPRGSRGSRFGQSKAPPGVFPDQSM